MFNFLVFTTVIVYAALFEQKSCQFPVISPVFTAQSPIFSKLLSTLNAHQLPFQTSKDAHPCVRHNLPSLALYLKRLFVLLNAFFRFHPELLYDISSFHLLSCTNLHVGKVLQLKNCSIGNKNLKLWTLENQNHQKVDIDC